MTQMSADTDNARREPQMLLRGAALRYEAQVDADERRCSRGRSAGLWPAVRPLRGHGQRERRAFVRCAGGAVVHGSLPEAAAGGGSA